jgi:hypothetical protein
LMAEETARPRTTNDPSLVLPAARTTGRPSRLPGRDDWQLKGEVMASTRQVLQTWTDRTARLSWPTGVDAQARAILFTAARTPSTFSDTPVSDEELSQIWELARWARGPAGYPGSITTT